MTGSRTRNRVLIVEDHPGIRDSLRALLECEGYSVDTAENGRVGLQRLRAGAPPSVILLDLNMPVMDGAAFRCEQLADAHLAQIPVVVCSAVPMDAANARQLRTAAYLTKPVNPEVLLSTIRAYAVNKPPTPYRQPPVRAPADFAARARTRVVRPAPSAPSVPGTPAPRHARGSSS